MWLNKGGTLPNLMSHTENTCTYSDWYIPADGRNPMIQKEPTHATSTTATSEDHCFQSWSSQLHRLHQVLWFGGIPTTMWWLQGKSPPWSTSSEVCMTASARCWEKYIMHAPWFLMEEGMMIILLGTWENTGVNECLQDHCMQVRNTY